MNMTRNPSITSMKREIVTLEDYTYYIDKYLTQQGIAEYFGVSPQAVSKLYLKLKSMERVEKRLGR